jgi:predicted dinucleotide-utilizing enzyme
MMMEHYKHIAVIDTGAFNPEELVRTVEPFAKIIDVPVTVIPGNLRLMDALLAGNWDSGEFLVVSPKGIISFEDSFFKNGPG